MDSNSGNLRSRVIKPVSIEVEERSGHKVLVVEDSAGNQYTTLRDDLVQEVPRDREEYVGSTWKINWSMTDEGFINFHGFEEEVDEEPVEKEIEPTSGRDRSITRQSAGHDASRIVSGKLASGKDLDDREIARELKKWTDYLKHYYRSGEWKE
ncbi:MAG: hypothetical protein ABEJ91_04370 [Candidatus Nanohaloarchaea archaeon]